MNIVRIILEVTGVITKPNPGETATRRGDSTLNALGNVSLLVNNSVVVSGDAPNLFWFQAFQQQQSSQWEEADFNDTSGPTSFPFRYFLELNMDLPGRYGSGLAAIPKGTQMIQLDLQFNDLGAIVEGPPASWTLTTEVNASVVETYADLIGPGYQMSILQSIFQLNKSGVTPQFPNANGRRDILSLWYFVRDAITYERIDIIDIVEILMYNNMSLVRSNVKTLLDIILARYGARITAPMAL
ncbi:MAG: hypothetical protein NUW37_00010, partial [Planctomycetes bacterium]|nr:hypothetical protein [Planctomycetota bacterium]